MTEKETRHVLEAMLYLCGLSQVERAAIKYCINVLKEREQQDDDGK